MISATTQVWLIVAVCTLCARVSTAGSSAWVGVSYGLDASSQPVDPSRAVELIKERGFSAVKLFRPDESMFNALAGSGLEVVTAVPNDRLEEFAANSAAALAWVDANIAPYTDRCNITGISVGNEVMGQRDGANSALYSLVPAMEALYLALAERKLNGRVRVVSPQDMSFLAASYPPSAGEVVPAIRDEMVKLLTFLNRTGSYAVLNCYPFFAYLSAPEQISRDLVFFKGSSSSGGYSDGSLFYGNMLDAMIDAAISAFEKLGFPFLPIVVGEVGWPSAGASVASLADAAEFNGALINHITSGKGTPKRPNTLIRAFVFELLDEDNKDAGPGEFERAWGVNYGNGTQKYPLDLTPATPASPPPTPPPTSPPVAPPSAPSPTPPPSPGTVIPAPAECDTERGPVQSAMAWACGSGGVLCDRLLGGSNGCWEGQSSGGGVTAVQASIVMNMYFQMTQQNTGTCVFGGSGKVVTEVPPILAGCGLASGGNNKWCVAACLG